MSLGYVADIFIYMKDEAREKQAFEVFLSHNSQDKPAVRALAALLTERGIRVWLDEEQLIPGRSWQPLLEKGIKESATGAVLVGADGVGPWENEEMQGLLQSAVDEKKPVIPVLLPGAPEEPDLPLFLRNRGWVDLCAGFGTEGMDKLIWGITGERPSRRPVPPRVSELIIAVTRLRHGADRLVGREKQLARLDTAWHDPNTHVVTIVAWGGVGKTALVVEWMARMARDGWRGAERVFDWSFYSQGTREQGAASADTFVAKALEFFGDPEMAKSPAAAWDKGSRLAQLVAQKRTLLVLDGVEPLQYPPGPVGGQLKDPALEALLKGLAQRNTGLCIVTTRESVTDLKPYRGTTAPEWLLEHLSDEAGAHLLFETGVKRAGYAQIRADDNELKDAAREVGGHALTLQLLGRYLAKAHDGDVRKRSLVRFKKADAKVQGGHAFKVMAIYEKWLLGQGSEDALRQLAILRLLGLFDRPADAGCLAALREEPAIVGLTQPFVGLNDDDWNCAVCNLVECSLISSHGNDLAPVPCQSLLDAHPLIREYFAQQLREQQPEAWQAGHQQLYEYLTRSVRNRSRPTLEELLPLCHSVAHACEAGLVFEAYEKVYRRRIVREHHDYLSSHLGGAATEERLLDLLGASSGFESFKEKKEHRAFLNRQWGLTLRKLGRAKLAVSPFIAAAKDYAVIEDWDRAVNASRHLGQSYLLTGDLKAARKSAGAAVRLVRRKGVSTRERIAALAGLAHVLHQWGENARAKSLFATAESDPARSRLRFLHHLPGVRYCDLLLDCAERAMWRQRLGVKAGRGLSSRAHLIDRCREVERRAKQAVRVSKSHGMPVGTGLNLLSLGRATFCRASLTITNIKVISLLESACKHLDDAVLGLEHAGEMDFQPSAFLARAWCSLVKAERYDRQGSHDQATACRANATADLDRAWQIAERGPMPLYMADIHLYRARLFHAVTPYPWDKDEQGKPRGPKDDLAAARKLIAKCGYGRRKEELEDAEEAAKSW